MTKIKQIQISKDLANRKILVIREFDAPLEQVWKAWTDSEVLDLWWAPKPWRAETKQMDFREGGLWLYCMIGPDGSKQWCRVDYKSIVTNTSFTIDDAFCDEEGQVTHDLPGMHWENQFTSTESGTKVQIEITFASVEDLQKIVELGFEVGFTSALTNLDDFFDR